MNNEQYEIISQEFDRLWDIHYPKCKGWGNEEIRKRFRKDWLAYLETQNITDDEYTDAICERIKGNENES